MSATQTVTTQNRAGSKLHAKRARVDEALRAALYLHNFSEGRWEKLITGGATDIQISHALTDEFGAGSGGGSQTESGVQFAYKGMPVLSFWMDTSSPYTTAKPTLQGNALVKRVREVLTIPQPVSIAAEASPETARTADSDTPDDDGSHADSREAGTDAHQFKASTGSNGKCATCKKPRSDKAHKAWAKAQRERVKSGGPTLDAGTWRERAAAMTGDIAHKMRPYDRPGRKTLRKIEDYESRIRVALQRGQWQGTVINLADAVDEGALPAVLFGLTNENQVRGLMNPDNTHDEQYGPQNMGPTIKTADEFKAAVEALKPFIPQLLEDPNLDPRDGTEWAVDTLATRGDATDGSTIAASGAVVEAAAPVDAPPRTFKSTIEVPLTDGDVAAKARLLSHLRVQIEELQAEKKQTDDGYKNRIGGLEEQCSELFRSIRSGRAELELDVYERRDYERNVVETVRVDCGDVVDSRPMRPSELQRPLIEL